MTIGQIYAYIKQENAKEASFDCIATIDDRSEVS
ncbi:BnaC03g65650D [Brassica napus]|uniref:BnaC03g65650D protein n=1 Tax=Brassica napus TaxID=3708 RepID=A0A078FYU1_BRANA|nr:BnaC03g65650D [Brassica napus]